MAGLRLDHRSRIPLHVQAEQLLREMIRRPEYQAGELLPDEVSLARRLGISRNTLREAISRLRYEGLLERRAGVGTRVASRTLESGMSQWHSFTHEMENKGVKVQTFEIAGRVVEADEDVARALQVHEGAAVLRLDRLRGWDDTPIVHFRSYLHPRLAIGADADFSRPLYELIEEKSGVVAEQAREEMSAVAASTALSRMLKVRKGSPLLLRQRVVRDASGRAIEYAVVHYRSDRFALTLDIRRQTQEEA